MAKVIGKDDTKVKRCTCGNCAAIVEYTPSESFRKKYAFDYLGDYEVGNFIQCPQCGKDINVTR